METPHNTQKECCEKCKGTGSYKIPVSSPIMAPYGKDDTTSVPCHCKIYGKRIFNEMLENRAKMNNGSIAWTKHCTCHVFEQHGYCEHTATDRQRRDEICTCKKLSPPYVHYKDCPAVTPPQQEKWERFENIYYGIHSKQNEKDLMQARHNAFLARAKSFISSSHIALLKGVVEMVGEDEDVSGLVPMDNYEHPEYDQAVGRNQERARLRTHLEQAIKEVDNK